MTLLESTPALFIAASYAPSDSPDGAVHGVKYTRSQGLVKIRAASLPRRLILGSPAACRQRILPSVARRRRFVMEQLGCGQPERRPRTTGTVRASVRSGPCPHGGDTGRAPRACSVGSQSDTPRTVQGSVCRESLRTGARWLRRVDTYACGFFSA